MDNADTAEGVDRREAAVLAIDGDLLTHQKGRIGGLQGDPSKGIAAVAVCESGNEHGLIETGLSEGC